MDVATGNALVSWVIQVKELVALLMLCILIVYTYLKLLPYLLDREESRAQREAERNQANLVALSGVVSKLESTMEQALNRIDHTLADVLRTTGKR